MYWLNHSIEGIQLNSIQRCLFLVCVCIYLFNRLVIFISSILKMKESFVIWDIMQEFTIEIWCNEIEKSFFFGKNVMSTIFSSNSLRFCLRINIQTLPLAPSVITSLLLLAQTTDGNHVSGYSFFAAKNRNPSCVMHMAWVWIMQNESDTFLAHRCEFTFSIHSTQEKISNKMRNIEIECERISWVGKIDAFLFKIKGRIRCTQCNFRSRNLLKNSPTLLNCISMCVCVVINWEMKLRISIFASLH